MRTVVFDLGQVVIQWDPYLSQEGFLTREEWEDFTVRTDFWTYNHAMDSGAGLSQTRTRFKQSHPADIEIFDRYVARFTSTLTGPVPGVLDVIRDVQALSVPTAVLSNWSRELFKHALSTVPFIDTIGPRVVSGEVGVAKPDRRIFELLFERLGLAPTEIVFIDDNVDNVEVARALGMDAILFRDADQLRTELSKRGLAPSMGLRRI